MKLNLLLCASLLLLLMANVALADLDSPAKTPASNRAWEIIPNHYQGSVNQNYVSVLDDNYYTVSSGLIGTSTPDTASTTWDPEITVQDVMAELANPWGGGRWEGHTGSSGLAVEMGPREDSKFKRIVPLF
jgi:hypothetical protein